MPERYRPPLDESISRRYRPDMLIPLALAAVLGASDPGPGSGLVCLETGYCVAPAGRDGRAAGGPMYLALGLVGAGVTVLRSERRARTGP